ncbi:MULTISPECIES: hypothetical protein [unclassified Bradyrhizobium]|uniref:hypothetical protein n=1 Tax=unclassified Bradyrhizobium TaxID=2631580 RepID=UPI00339A7E59
MPDETAEEFGVVGQIAQLNLNEGKSLLERRELLEELVLGEFLLRDTACLLVLNVTKTFHDDAPWCSAFGLARLSNHRASRGLPPWIGGLIAGAGLGHGHLAPVPFAGIAEMRGLRSCDTFGVAASPVIMVLTVVMSLMTAVAGTRSL